MPTIKVLVTVWTNDEPQNLRELQYFIENASVHVVVNSVKRHIEALADIHRDPPDGP